MLFFLNPCIYITFMFFWKLRLLLYPTIFSGMDKILYLGGKKKSVFSPTVFSVLCVLHARLSFLHSSVYPSPNTQALTFTLHCHHTHKHLSFSLSPSKRALLTFPPHKNDTCSCTVNSNADKQCNHLSYRISRQYTS